MEFEYFYERKAMGTIDIEDIGNCALDLFNDIGEEKVIIIETHLGQTTVLINGPFNVDSTTLPKEVECILKQFQFSQPEIGKIIRTSLNDFKFKTTQAIEITKEEALDKCRDLVAYMKNLT